MGESKSCTVLCCEFPFVQPRLKRENNSPLPQRDRERERERLKEKKKDIVDEKAQVVLRSLFSNCLMTWLMPGKILCQTILRKMRSRHAVSWTETNSGTDYCFLWNENAGQNWGCILLRQTMAGTVNPPHVKDVHVFQVIVNHLL